MLKKVTNYLKNVGKSLGYALSDVIEADAGEIKGFLDTNSHIIRNAYKSVRDYRTSVNKVESSFRNSKIYVAADIGIKAVFEDLANGTFYNKERENEIDAKYSGMDMSDDFDIEAFEKGLQERDKNLTDGDKAIVSSIEKSSKQNATLISDTIARTTSANIQNQRAASRLEYLQNTQMISGIRAGVDTLNEVGKTLNVSNSMFKTIADNQKQFFIDTSKTLKEMHAMQRELLEMQRNIYADKRQDDLNKQRNKRKGYNDVFDASGVIDFEAYAEVVKENFNRALSESEVGGLFTGMGLGKDANLLASFAANPFKDMTKSFVKNLIPEVTREATRSLNSTFGGLFGTLIGRLNEVAVDENANPLLQLLGKIAGVKPKHKTDIQTNKFQKGPVPFDGITKKAIIDVIPGYLRRIEAALTGNAGRIYDYDSGKWTDLNNYADYKKNYIEGANRRATSDLKSSITKYSNKFIFEDRDMNEQFQKAMDAVMQDIAQKGNWRRYYRAAKPGNEGAAEKIARDLNIDSIYGADFIRIIGDMMRQADKYNKSEFRGATSQLAGNVARSQEQLTRSLEDLELKAGPIITALEEGMKDKETKTDVRMIDKHGVPLPNSFAGSILKTRDRYDKDVFDYLRSLDTQIQWFREFASSGGLGGNTNNSKPQTIDKLRERGTEVLSDDDLRELLLRADFPNIAGNTDQIRHLAATRFNTYSREQLINAINNSNVYDIEFNHTDELDRDALISELSEMSGLAANRFNHLSTDEIRRRHAIASNKNRRGYNPAMPYAIASINNARSYDDILAARNESELNTKNKTEAERKEEENKKKQKAHERDVARYRESGKFVVTPRQLANDSGYSVYGEYTAPMEQLYITEEARKKGTPREKTFWEDMFGISPLRIVDDEEEGNSKDFFQQLKDAKSIGDKYQVIKQATEKLSAAPMTMLTKVIQKADESIYHFMFGDIDGDVDEDDNPTKGLMAKIVEEVKKTFSRLNEWLNEKVLDPLKAWFEKQGIKKPSDALDKITGGLYSDAKEAVLSTIFGEKNSDGKREGGWAQPFKDAFGYNAEKATKAFKDWEEVKRQNEQAARERAELRRKSNPNIDYDRTEEEEVEDYEEQSGASGFNSDDYTGSMAHGTSGRTKTDIYTMLSEGEYVTDPFGRKTRVSKQDELFPHHILKGSLIENPAGKAKRDIQERNEKIRRANFFDYIGLNANAEDTSAFRDFEKYLFPNGEQEKLQFISIADGLEDRILEKLNSGDFDGDQEYAELNDILNRWSKLLGFYQAIKNPLPRVMTKSDYFLFIKNNRLREVINFVRKTTQYLDKLATYEDIENTRNVSAEDMIAASSNQQAKPIDPSITVKGLDPTKNQWLKRQLSRVQYDVNDPVKKDRVEKIADTTAKTTFGAGAGLLLGNPLIGAGIGLLTGIAKNNKEMNEFLFGSDGEGGLISKNTRETFEKAMPDMTKFGIGGAVAGLLTGMGPIPGILLGGALSFAKNNNEIMETLFGPEEERAEKFRKFKEEALPRMGIGAAAGALLGPFGLLGGALIGSGAGLLTTTNTFKDIMFGDEDKDGKRHGGIMGALKESFVDPLKNFAEDFALRSKEFIRDYIIDPIKGAIKPLTNAAKHIAIDAVKLVPRILDKVFVNFLGIPLGDTLRDKVFGPIGRLAGKIIGAPAWLGKQILKLPGTIIGGIGNAVRASQIRRGRAEYMTAEERLDWRAAHKNRFLKGGEGMLGDLYALIHPFKAKKNRESLETDQRLAQLDKNEAATAYNELNSILDTEKTADRAYRKSRKDMNVFIDERFRDHGFISTQNNKTKIIKALQEGKFDKALQLIKTLKDKNGNTLSGDELVEFEEKLKEYYNTFHEMKERRTLVGSNSRRDQDSIIASVEDKIKKAGITGFNLKTRADQERLRDLLRKERDAKGAIKDDEKHQNGALLSDDLVHQNKMNTMFLEAMHNLVGVTEMMAKSFGAYDQNPEAYRKVSEGMNTVYDEVKDLEKESDVDSAMHNFAHQTAESMSERQVEFNAASRRAEKISAKDAARAEKVKSERAYAARKAGYSEGLEANSLWSSDDPKVTQLFKLVFRVKCKIDINTALEIVTNKKHNKFLTNLELACKFANGAYIDADRLKLIAKIEHSTTMPTVFSKANSMAIPLFDSKYFKDVNHIMAVLGVSRNIIMSDTFMDSLKEIKHKCLTYKYAPSIAEINGIFKSAIFRQNSEATTDKFYETGSPETVDTEVENVSNASPSEDNLEEVPIPTTNANANHLDRFIKTNATIGELSQDKFDREAFFESMKDKTKWKQYKADKKAKKKQEKEEAKRQREIDKRIKEGYNKLNRIYKVRNQEYIEEHEDEIRAANLEKINEYINNNTTRSQSELAQVLEELKHIKINTDIDVAIAKEQEKDRKIEKKREAKAEKEEAKLSKKDARHKAYKNIKLWNVPGIIRQWLQFRGEDIREGYEKLDNKVRAVGNRAADYGNNIFTALSHLPTMLSAGYKGSKARFDKNLAEGKYTSLGDKINAALENQRETIQLLKDQDKKEGKTPWVKKIFQFLFGKTLGGFFGKTIAVPLVVGAYKKFVHPWLKNTIGPWLYDKLWGDPNRDDDGLLGRLSTWVNNKVVPKIFGTKNEDGVWNNGLFSGLANWWDQQASPFIFGTKNDDGSVKTKGLIGKVQDMFFDLGKKIHDGIHFIGDFLTNTDHNSETFGHHAFSAFDKGSTGVLKLLAETWAEGAATIVPWATELILKTAPTIIGGIVEGVKNTIGSFWFGTNTDTTNVDKALEIGTKDLTGSITTSADSSKLLATINTDNSVINSNMTEVSKQILETGATPASGGNVGALLDTGNPIYNNGVDASGELEELNEIYTGGKDEDLDRAIELAKNNLVILPPSMFHNDYESYKTYLDSMLGEGSTESYGWDYLQTIQDPILVPTDSEAYKMMKDRISAGRRIELALFKIIVTGGKGCKLVPALSRATSKVLAWIAKKSCQGLLGKIPGAIIKLTSNAFGVVGAIGDAARIVGDTGKVVKYSNVIAKAGNDTAKIVKAESKIAKAEASGLKHFNSIKEFFERLFGNETVIGKIANALSKPKNWVKAQLAGGKIEKIAMSLANLLGKVGKGAGKVLEKAAIALPFVNGFVIGDAFVKGFFDAPNILGIFYKGEKYNPIHCIVAGLLSALNALLFDLIPTYDLCNWIVDTFIIGIFHADTDLIDRHKQALDELNAYNKLEGTNLTLEEYAEIKYPTAKQLFDKDLFSFNVEGLANAFIAGWNQILTGTVGNNFGTGKEIANTIDKSILDYANNTANSITSSFGKGHIDQRASNMRYNAPGDTIYQTIADSGCGPAAAATVLSQYGRGKVEEAAQYSLDNGYKEPNGGTYPGFFGDYLGQHGIDTQYETNATGVMDSLKKGNPVVLMGSDTGRGSTPYAGADGSHYVTATGLDRSGNMIIEDPDDRRGARKYSAKNVLNKTSIAISTRPGAGKRKTGKGHKLPKSLTQSSVFGKGGYSYRDYDISEIDKDGLQDLRLWVDPDTIGKDNYINAIAQRIYKGAVNWPDGLMRTHSKEIATAAVYAGMETGMDPAILLAIGIYESGWGASDIAKNDLNFWGWNVNTKTLENGEGWTVFGSGYSTAAFKTAFLNYAKAISKNYYDNGQTCLYRFVDNGGKNQYPGDFNQMAINWVVNVAYYMKAIHDVVGQNETNMSWHPKNQKPYLLTNVIDKFYTTNDGFTGMIGTDTNPRNGGDNRLDIAKYSSNETENSGTNFFSMIKELGSKILRGIFGNAYDFLFGTMDNSSSESKSGNYNSGYYDTSGNWVSTSGDSSTSNSSSGNSSNIQAGNATEWFTKTMSETGHPIYKSYGWQDVARGYPDHKGIDYATYDVEGLPVKSPVDATLYRVTDTGKENDTKDLNNAAAVRKASYGYSVYLKDKNGEFFHRFGHLDRTKKVFNVGETGVDIHRGDLIGYSGNTGASSGAHLHYEIDKKDSMIYPNGNDRESIDPDTMYDWSQYDIDEESAEYLKDLSTKELIERQKKKNNEFFAKELGHTKRSKMQETLNKYNTTRTDLREELIQRSYDPNYAEYADEIRSILYPELPKTTNISTSSVISDKKIDTIIKNINQNKNTIDYSNYGKIEFNKYMRYLLGRAYKDYESQYSSDTGYTGDMHPYAREHYNVKHTIKDTIESSLADGFMAVEEGDKNQNYKYGYKNRYGDYLPHQQKYDKALTFDNEFARLSDIEYGYYENYRYNKKNTKSYTEKYKHLGYDLKNNIVDIHTLNNLIDKYKYFVDDPKNKKVSLDFINTLVQHGNDPDINNMLLGTDSKYDQFIGDRIPTSSLRGADPKANYGEFFNQLVPSIKSEILSNYNNAKTQKDLLLNQLSLISDLQRESGNYKDPYSVDSLGVYELNDLKKYANEFGLGKKSSFGKGKSSPATSMIKRIAKAGIKANKDEGTSKAKKSIIRLAKETANYVKKFNINPFASEAIANTISKDNTAQTTFGKAKKPHISNPYGKAKTVTPTTTQVKFNPQTTNKTEVKVEAKPTNLGLSQLDYTKLLITIIDVLGKIADNTEKLDKVIMLLKNNATKLGIDASGLGKGKTNQEKLSSITHSLRNHKLDPSWTISAINRNNDSNGADAFMTNIYKLASE